MILQLEPSLTTSMDAFGIKAKVVEPSIVCDEVVASVMLFRYWRRRRATRLN